MRSVPGVMLYGHPSCLVSRPVPWNLDDDDE